jgi:cytochrome c oxidase assembly factor CtaG
VWPLVSPSRVLPRIGFGAAMIYAFVLMIADLPLWAALIFAEHPIYETYMLAPRICWLNASQDMIMGAVVMKAFNEIFALSNMGWAFFAWYRKER